MALLDVFAWLGPLALSGALAAVGVAARQRLRPGIERAVRLRPTPARELLLRALDWPAALAIALALAALLIGLWPLPPAPRGLLVALLKLTFVLGAGGTALAALEAWKTIGPEGSRLRQTSARRTAQAAIVATVGLLALALLGLPLLPWLIVAGAAGAVGGLALRETVANFLAGLILAGRGPLTTGEWIELEGGPEGRLESLGALHATLVESDGRITLVPNRRLVEGMLRSSAHPEKARRVEVEFHVDGGLSLEKAKAAAIAVARSVVKTEKTLAGRGEPQVFLEALDGAGARLVASLPVKNAEAGRALRDVFLLELAQRFKSERLKFGGS